MELPINDPNIDFVDDFVTKVLQNNVKKITTLYTKLQVLCFTYNCINTNFFITTEVIKANFFKNIKTVSKYIFNTEIIIADN